MRHLRALAAVWLALTVALLAAPLQTPVAAAATDQGSRFTIAVMPDTPAPVDDSPW